MKKTQMRKKLNQIPKTMKMKKISKLSNKLLNLFNKYRLITSLLVSLTAMRKKMANLKSSQRTSQDVLLLMKKWIVSLNLLLCNFNRSPKNQQSRLPESHHNAILLSKIPPQNKRKNNLQSSNSQLSLPKSPPRPSREPLSSQSLSSRKNGKTKFLNWSKRLTTNSILFKTRRKMLRKPRNLRKRERQRRRRPRRRSKRPRRRKLQLRRRLRKRMRQLRRLLRRRSSRRKEKLLRRRH